MIIFLGNGLSLELYRDVIESTKDTKPDIVVSCQYPFKVPDSLLETHICVNIHYGELPRYAGCNPVFWQVYNDTFAGCTLHYMDSTFDGGDIIEVNSFPIGNMTADEVYDELAHRGKQTFLKHFGGILKGTAPRRKQNLDEREYYKKTDIDFKRMREIQELDDKRIRAVHFRGKQYPIIEVKGRMYELRATEGER